MSSDDLTLSLELNNIGKQMYELIVELYPLCRSITGNGFRKSLNIIKKHIPLIMHEVPTGTEVFDWVVPKEWNIHDAYIKNANGEKVIDFQSSNLHVVNYSVPIHTNIPLKELKEHLHSIPEYPDWIPYKTSYYKENWGFCLTHRKLQSLDEGEYEVFIDSSLEPGSLTYGEVYIKGETDDEILISCHCCHPSLCNDNLSGMAMTTYLASQIISQPTLRYSYRFLFIPGTIGSITWLSRNEDKIQRIKHGMVVACVGDPGISTYKKSRRGDAEIDKASLHVLRHSSEDFKVEDFSPYGYDERQYCSPAFNLPIGCLSRTPYGQYPEYHTSADNLEFVGIKYLVSSFMKYRAVFEILEHNKKFINTNPKCEPQLGKRDLYGAFGGKKDSEQYELAMLWVLNYSDGQHTILDIAEKSGYPFEVIHKAAKVLMEVNLLNKLRNNG